MNPHSNQFITSTTNNTVPGYCRLHKLILLSAHTAEDLTAVTQNFISYLKESSGVDLAGIAFDLAVGKRVFTHKRMLVCTDIADALTALERLDPARVFNRVQKLTSRPVVFMFPGVGEQYSGMSRELYESEEVFRRSADECCELLKAEVQTDFRELLFDGHEAAQRPRATAKLDLRRVLGRESEDGRSMRDVVIEKELSRTSIAQIAVFIVEYALSQLWISFGVKPQAMIGYSLGEYLAATVSGVLSLKDALHLVAQRAQLMESLPRGAMLTVALSETKVRRLLQTASVTDLGIAAINGPETCVLSGTEEAITQIEARLTGEVSRRVETTHAVHSQMMRPIFDEVTKLVRGVKLNSPRIPYVSNLTGTWTTAEEALDHTYWSRHMCQEVRFEEGLGEILADKQRLFLEAGPGHSLGSFARQHPECSSEQAGSMVSSLRGKYDSGGDEENLLRAVGKLWLAGVEIAWEEYYAGERRRRVVLPDISF